MHLHLDGARWASGQRTSLDSQMQNQPDPRCTHLDLDPARPLSISAPPSAPTLCTPAFIRSPSGRHRPCARGPPSLLLASSISNRTTYKRTQSISPSPSSRTPADTDRSWPPVHQCYVQCACSSSRVCTRKDMRLFHTQQARFASVDACGRV
ncbi:hypothetical protein BV20DRAFT_742135 [Pilatotrama ljubarskyi]|nr:hypothetical protein BV20DRAFT_742135 [Pilatotrama ljubarskyi]